MHPSAMWIIAIEHQRMLRAEAEADRRLHAFEPADQPGRLPTVLRYAAAVTGRSLAVAGHAAIAASCRLETLASDEVCTVQ